MRRTTLQHALLKSIWIAILALILSGCGEPPPEKLTGFRRLDGDCYSRLIELGEQDKCAKPGDFISVRLAYATWSDSIFFRGGRRFQLAVSNYDGSIDQCFSTLSAGDSAVFYIDAYRFFTQTLCSTLPHFLDSGEMMRIDVRMLSIQDSATFSKEQEAFLHWIEDFGEYEKVKLQQFLREHRYSTQPIDSVYYIPLKQGHGPQPQHGDTLTIEFEGRFLNGKYFDSTRKRFEPFVFVLGQKWQVIEGLERAVKMMREGEHALFVLPSGIAFGQEGSSTGIIPPYTPVVFEVELTELKSGNQNETSD